MSISSHAICDHCERKLIPIEEEGVTEDYLADSGWVTVKWSREDDDGDGDLVDETRDFCSFDCASRWCAKEGEDGEAYGGTKKEGPQEQGGRAF